MADFPVVKTAATSATQILSKHINNLEDKVGTDSSIDPTSLDYRVKHTSSIDPGHKHSKLWASDGSPEAVTVNAAGKVSLTSSTTEDVGFTLGQIVRPSSGGTLAAGMSITSNILAGANSDILYGFFLNPTFTDGAYSSVKHYSFYSAVADPAYFAGNFGVGTLVFGTSAAKVFGMGIGTPPSTSPADIAQLYVKDRNGVAGTASLHIRNEDDTAGYSIQPSYGEMYHYENTDPCTITTQSIYHALIIKTTGLCKGWTYKIGTTALISAFATYDSGNKTLVTSNGHNLVSGEIVTITGCAKAEYNDAHIITWIDANSFTIPIAYGAEAIGGAEQWIRGSSLRANAGSAGVYRIAWNCTVLPVAKDVVFKVESKQNMTDLDNMAASFKVTTAAYNSPMSAGGLVTVADGDYIWLQVKNETSTTDLTFRHFNLNISKVG